MYVVKHMLKGVCVIITHVNYLLYLEMHVNENMIACVFVILQMKHTTCDIYHIRPTVECPKCCTVCIYYIVLYYVFQQ